MTLNGVMALILRYLTEFVYDVVVEKFAFAISSSDEFLVVSEQHPVPLSVVIQFFDTPLSA